MEYTYFDDIPNANVTQEVITRYHEHMNNTERKCYQESNTVNGIKIIKNNYKIQPNEELIKNNKIRIHCSECDSELEITEEDTHIGWMGARFITCPCCGEESMVDELDGITLTKDNVEFPTHYYSFSDGVHIDDDTVNKWVKECIEEFDPNDENDWCRFTGSGDTMVFVSKLDEDEEYDVYVCKNYYETFIPFDKNNG